MTENQLDILYDGFRQYQKKIKGYFVCASKEDIMQWEEWKLLVSERMKARKRRIK